MQRLVPASSRQPHNDVAGFIYAAFAGSFDVPNELRGGKTPAELIRTVRSEGYMFMPKVSRR